MTRFDRLAALEKGETDALTMRKLVFRRHDDCAVATQDEEYRLEDRFDKRRLLPPDTWHGHEVRRTVPWTAKDWRRHQLLASGKQIADDAASTIGALWRGFVVRGWS